MMQLPPGCKVSYNIWIDVDTLTDEICEWFELIGGTVATNHNTYLNRHGKSSATRTVQYGKAKPSYCRQDGTQHVKINFSGDDASVASMFLLKFSEHVINHNMKQEFDLIK
jgi:hypothetical protein